MSIQLPSVIGISGPTSSGKSELAVSLAERFNGAIVNADSIQVYAEFNVGTGKPPAELLSRAEHCLFSYVAPTEHYDAGRYGQDALVASSEIQATGKNTIFAGGTGLYFRSALQGLVETPQIPDEVRAEVNSREAQIRARGLEGAELASEFHCWLKQLEPEAAVSIDSSNLVRIKRAIELRLSGVDNLMSLYSEHRAARADRVRGLVFVLFPERDDLYRRINKQVDKMLAAGWLEEVELLRSKYGPDVEPFQAIGYRHLLEVVESGADLELAISAIKTSTRRYAKRQLTWWKNQPRALGWKTQKSSVVGLTGSESKISLNSVEKLTEQFLAGELLPSSPGVTVIFVTDC